MGCFLEVRSDYELFLIIFPDGCNQQRYFDIIVGIIYLGQLRTESVVEGEFRRGRINFG